MNGSVGPYDNVTDFNGTSGRSFDFENSTDINLNGNNLSLYEADSNSTDLVIPASSSGSAVISGLANFDGGVRTMSGANVCVSYTYEVEEGVAGTSNNAEVECKRIGCPAGNNITSCNARDQQFNFTTCDPSIMSLYDCTFTVETPDSMHGQYFLTVDANTNEGLNGTMAENEYWFLNPVIALSTDGNISFDGVEPGTTAYSQTILVSNDAEPGSGVLLDMFISGTDFYDPSSDGARCSGNTNKLALGAFSYFATNGAFSTSQNGIPVGSRGICGGSSVVDSDSQGYVTIPYSTDITGSKRIMRWNSIIRGASPSSSVVEQDWNCGNALSPGSEMALTFRLNMPEPCVGDFSDGQISFWGEAI